MFGDEHGIFWNDPPRVRKQGVKTERPLPPIPETSWVIPEEFPDLSGHGAIAIDCETYDPDLRTKGPGVRRDGKIVGVAVGTEAGFRAYYPVDHALPPNLPKKLVFGWLNEQLSRPGQPKIGANLLYDLDYLEGAGIHVEGPFYDVQIAEPLLNENALRYNLDALAKNHLDETKVEDDLLKWLHEAFGEDEANIKSNIWRAPPAVVGPYAIGDIDLPIRIFKKQRVALENQEGLWNLYQLESALIPLLLRMRQRGVPVNVGRAEELSHQLEARCSDILDEIKHETGIRPDVWSADDMARVFDQVGVTYPLTEKTGRASIRKDWLEKQIHPIARKVQDVRRLDKFKGTFIDGYVIRGHINGRIHCQFHQLRGEGYGAVSGRFSSSHPNLQNIPVRDKELGKLIRSLFEPEDGQRWWKFDWSQIEYRLICHYAALLNLPGIGATIERYNNDKRTDYHQAIADLAGIPRPDAKNLNFGLAYGQGLALLCYNLGLNEHEGKQLIDTYHKRAPFIRRLSQIVVNQINKNGEIRTLLDRRRHFDTWEKNNKIVPVGTLGARRAFTHKGLNALIQGSAADIMKKAMVMIWESGVCDVIGVPHLTVHDELDGSFDDSPAHNEALDEIQHIMEHCVELLVPLLSDGEIGINWGTLQPR